MKRPNGTGTVKKLRGKRRKPYQVLVTDGFKMVNGVPKQNQVSLGTFETKKDAMKALSEYHVNPVDLSKRDVTFAQVYDIVKAQSNWKYALSNSMSAAFKKCLLIHEMSLPDIRKYELQLVADSMESMSKSSQNNVKILISAIFNYGMEYDIIPKDYSRFMKFPEASKRKEKSAYSIGEIRIIEKHGDDVQKILLYTGMRISELLNMKVSDIKNYEGKTYFDVQGTKTKSSVRIIPIHDKIAGIVKDNLEGTYLIEPHRTNTIYRSNIYLPFNDKYNIDHTSHDIRRTFSTYAKSCGMDEYYRKYILGHKQGDITNDIYTDITLKDLHDEMIKLKY